MNNTLRIRIIALLLAVMLLGATGCRAMLVGAVVGAVVGYAIVTAHRDPPPRYHVHTHEYYYHDTWHSEPPRGTTVEIYYHGGNWYRCESRGSSRRGGSSHYHESRHYSGY